MDQIQSTYRDVIDFYNTANRWIQEHKEESKFRYAVARTLKSAGRVVGQYQDKIEGINIDFCMAEDDGKGEILRDPHGQYKFTKDGMRKRNDARAKLFDSPIKFDVHFASELPKELSETDRDAFLGFVIKEKAPPK